MLEIEIDGKKLTVPDGSTVMEAANSVGTYIPHFCYHKKLSIAANCRMCLVEVEKAPKPLPACATPVTDGMKVHTHSSLASKAQKGVMEFLLINHPLDCPICDQGGECQLQDLAVGYGNTASRYQEEKRVVVNKNMGPLISTDMTRCIHCTRCVRFTEEIGGFQEIGMANRGEHSEILPFINKTVDSEISGNVIDLCPVGALTSKPFRYSARTWELSRRKSVSPHDGLGSNLVVQVKQSRVMRVLPRENESINECWIADRDRFSYEALNSEARLTKPMLKHDGKWHEVEWQTALDYVVHGLTDIKARHGAASIGALATPHSTLEELYLLQKLVRGLGCGNVDTRMRQRDFRGDAVDKHITYLGMPITALRKLDRILLIGANVRKEQPLIAAKLRHAVKKGAQLSVIQSSDDDLLCSTHTKLVVAPNVIAAQLAAVLKALLEIKGAVVPDAVSSLLADALVTESARAIAISLSSGEHGAILLGQAALYHPDYSMIRLLAGELATLAGVTVGELTPAANTVGAALAGAHPLRGELSTDAIQGLNAREMFEQPRRAYLLLNAEVELDAHNPQQAMSAVKQADMVVAMSAFKHEAIDYADVLLPIAPFSETSGTFVNMEGLPQSFNGVVKPLGDARPAWKVLRVLANLLGLSGFDFNTSEEVRDTVLKGGQASVDAQLKNVTSVKAQPLEQPAGLARLGEVPIYQSDALVRRAPALQMTKDGKTFVASINGKLANELGLTDGCDVKVTQQDGYAKLKLVIDDKLPDQVVRVPSGHPAVMTLGDMFGSIALERV
ncbi:NADH-quinone oxidoreductase subunit G [Chitinivorax tropicus]|uniref:NADH-quinone oxidoreductase n=1 Tax=Chitinivorax tropicus TaxID=714531 RepID=A0A840MGK4_9PROT|nr:NADH-quinone oxidoreductase subunit NuoG [Chitinivorax tropicus]MBB5017778.1 NADH-quinone oxidoreductase subunit G [Chitinivorax tropicus]